MSQGENMGEQDPDDPRGASRPLPDTTTMHLAYAEASVMVLECLMRLMIERKLLSMDEILHELEVAIGAKRTLMQEGSHPEIANVAAGVLSTLANSLAASWPKTRP